MAEGMDEEQLVDFCHQLGLAKDGYLNQNDLSVVCRCIGLIAPEEMMKQLFEELDGDNDGKVCLAELSLMLRGMQLPKKSSSSTSFSEKKVEHDVVGPVVTNQHQFSPITVNEHCAFSILDPEHMGFAKVGVIIDLWSQLGINPDVGLQILKELGFSSNSKLNSINLVDLARSLDDEIDNHSKDDGNNSNLPPIFHAALITYRTEAQYLKSLCESMECEREKLKADINEAHTRCDMMATEVDEQNARLEHSNQLHLHKIESKYAEQLHSLQKSMGIEKESLQQTIQCLESQLKILTEEEVKLKGQIVKLKQENTHLENEVKNLTNEVKNVVKLKQKIEDEMSRYLELEKKLHETEKQSLAKLSISEENLKKSLAEIQILKDQNDELSSQLEKVKESLNGLKSEQVKRFYVRRRKKGSTETSTGSGSGGVSSKQDEARRKFDEDHNCVPLQKIGKFHNKASNYEIENSLFQIEHDPDDAESSLEHAFLSCSSQDPESGTFLVNNGSSTINLSGFVMDETCTDQSLIQAHADTEDQLMMDEEDDSNQNVQKLKDEFKSLQSQLVILRRKLKMIPSSSSEESMLHEIENSQVVISDDKQNEEIKNKNRILELEEQLKQSQAKAEADKQELETHCSNLEKSLDLLQSEYEKCEEYWHGKLQEERVEYEHDRNINDEKFYELQLKIQEYEELVLQQQESEVGTGNGSNSNKLPPIEERASLEKQVNDLDDECNNLKQQLQSMQSEQQSILSNYQRNWELKTTEECSHLEQQVKALQIKCQEYEIRLTSITEEDGKEVESGLIPELRATIEDLENKLKEQSQLHKEHVQHLEKTWNQKNTMKSSQEKPNPVQGQTSCAEAKSPSLLEMIQNAPPHKPSVTPPEQWVQPQPSSQSNFYQASNNKTSASSLPYIPVAFAPNFSTGQWTPWSNFDTWTPPIVTSTTTNTNTNQQSKKAWCHVEVGWLQALRNKLKQREEQCLMLQRALCSLEQQHEKILADINYQHNAEISNWESLMKASQELVRQQAVKQKEQADKLIQADLIMKDLWSENSKLVSSFNSAQQRIIYLESFLQQPSSNPITTFALMPQNIPQIPNNGGDSASRLNTMPSSTSFSVGGVSLPTNFSNNTTFNSFSKQQNNN